MAKDLIDEISVLVFPLVLGKGKRLFGEGTRPGALKMIDSKVSTTGVIIGRYKRAGAIRTGSFAMEKPTDAEIKRRAKMKAEG